MNIEPAIVRSPGITLFAPGLAGSVFIGGLNQERKNSALKQIRRTVPE